MHWDSFITYADGISQTSMVSPSHKKPGAKSILQLSSCMTCSCILKEWDRKSSASLEREADKKWVSWQPPARQRGEWETALWLPPATQEGRWEMVDENLLLVRLFIIPCSRTVIGYSLRLSSSCPWPHLHGLWGCGMCKVTRVPVVEPSPYTKFFHVIANSLQA